MISNIYPSIEKTGSSWPVKGKRSVKSKYFVQVYSLLLKKSKKKMEQYVVLPNILGKDNKSLVLIEKVGCINV